MLPTALGFPKDKKVTDNYFILAPEAAQVAELGFIILKCIHDIEFFFFYG